jgi:hypothetical protein
MAYALEVKYFNSFTLKKVLADGRDCINGDQSKCQIGPGGGNIDWGATWPSLITATAANNTILPVFPQQAYDGPDEDGEGWVIEESRIRGGYNNTQVGFGVKAYAVEPQPLASLRDNSLIYSGIFNSRTGVNQTNVFSVGEEITKSADPANGSIQKLYAEDTNLIIFQENKVSRALIDKDAIYTAEGGGAITNVNTTIGTIQPYAGEYGISKNPESFAVYGFAKYFVDSNRNAVLRLSGNGIQEISNFGMIDYFRDNLSIVAQNEGKALGSYDIYSKQYILSLRAEGPFSEVNDTVVFDESVQGWVSFMSYKPDFMFSIKGKFYTTVDDSVWEHYSPNVNHGSFYGVNYDSAITFVSNQQVSTSKVFKTINYEGDSGWEVFSMTTSEGDIASTILSYLQGTYDSSIPPLTGQSAIGPGSVAPINYAGFMKQEGKYKAIIKNNSSLSQGEVLFGPDMTGIKGYYNIVTLKTDNVTDFGGRKELFAASLEYVRSSY